MLEFVFWIVGFTLAIAVWVALIAVRVVIWAGMFWFAAWLFPGVEEWAQQHGAHFWYGGVVVGLLTLSTAK